MAARDTIAVLGASARGATFSVLRSGRKAIAADLFADADLRRVCHVDPIRPYPAGLLPWLIQRTAAHPGLPWCYTGALENSPELIDQLADYGILLGNRGHIVRSVRCPTNLRDVLARAGLPFPETRPSAADLPRDGSWLMKTYRGSCGSGVRAYDSNVGELIQGAVLQRLVEGENASALFVGNRRTAVLLGVTKQLVGETWTGAAQFQYAGSTGPLVLDDPMLADIRRIGEALVGAFELVGLFGVDLVLTSDAAWTVEVNPRYTASVEVLERCRGVGAMQAHYEACCHSIVDRGQGQAIERSGVCTGKAIVYATQTHAITERLTAQWLREAGPISAPAVGDVPVAGTIASPGDPVLSVFADGATCDEVTSRLQSAVGLIRQGLCNHA